MLYLVVLLPLGHDGRFPGISPVPELQCFHSVFGGFFFVFYRYYRLHFREVVRQKLMVGTLGYITAGSLGRVRVRQSRCFFKIQRRLPDSHVYLWSTCWTRSCDCSVVNAYRGLWWVDTQDRAAQCGNRTGTACSEDLSSIVWSSTGNDTGKILIRDRDCFMHVMLRKKSDQKEQIPLSTWWS